MNKIWTQVPCQLGLPPLAVTCKADPSLSEIRPSEGGDRDASFSLVPPDRRVRDAGRIIGKTNSRGQLHRRGCE
jgi:hypothetical protein